MLEVVTLLSNKVCVPSKTEDLNLNVFDMITRINVSKTLTKNTSCKCECKLDGRKCNWNQKWNNCKSWCKCKNPKEHNVCENILVYDISYKTLVGEKALGIGFSN